MKPFDKFLLNVANLFHVKAIITLVMVFIFAFKVFNGMEISVDFLTIFTVVITYWLCQRKRRDEENEKF